MSTRECVKQFTSSVFRAEVSTGAPYTALFGAGRACWDCQRRFKARRFSVREDDLIQEALNDEFGENNLYKSSQRRVSVIDSRCAPHASTLVSVPASLLGYNEKT